MKSNFTQIRISLGWAAITLLLLCVALSITLLIVSSIDNEPAISVIALVLAIFAFLLQIFTWVLDLLTQHERELKASEIAQKTMQALEEIRQANQALNVELKTNYQQIFTAFVEAQSVSSGGESSNDETKIVAVFQSLLDQQQKEQAELKIQARNLAQSRAGRVRSWPKAEMLAELINEGLTELDPRVFSMLDILGGNVEFSYQQDNPEGWLVSDYYKDVAPIAFSFGLTHQSPEGLATLTDRGITCASLIRAFEPIPDEILNLWPDLPKVRSRSQH